MATKKAKTPRTRSKKKAKKPVKIATVTHYFNKIGVAVLKTEKTLNKGDKILIQSDTPKGLTNFKQNATYIQHNNKFIKRALKGKEIGLKVKDRVRKNDIVYKI